MRAGVVGEDVLDGAAEVGPVEVGCGIGKDGIGYDILFLLR